MEHQHRRCSAELLAQLLAQGRSLHAWEHDIEDHCIKAPGSDTLQPFMPGACMVEHEAAGFEELVQVRDDVRVVFDDQELHGRWQILRRVPEPPFSAQRDSGNRLDPAEAFLRDQVKS